MNPSFPSSPGRAPGRTLGHPFVLPWRLAWLVGLAILTWMPALQAATYTWTGAGFFGSQDYVWSNPNNWAELAAPQDGEQGVQLVFPNSNAPRATTNDVVNLVIKSVLFQGANYSVHGAGANGVTVSLRGDNGGDFSLVAAAAGCQFGSSTRLQLASDGVVAVASGAQLTIKSRVSGVYGLTKISPGTLSFQGLQANTFTGPLTVLGGVADFRGVGTAVPGPLIVGDGSPQSAPIARWYLNDQLADHSSVTVNAQATLEFDGHSDTVGSLTLAGGTVTTLEGVIAGTLTLNGNVRNLAGGGGIPSTISGRLSLGSTTRGFDVEAGSALVIDASISGATSGLVKAGLGRLTLAGAGNSYVGPTTVQAGELLLVGPARPGSVDNGTTVAAGAQLLLQDVDIGGESLGLAGSGQRLALRYAGTNAWAGPVALSGDCRLGLLGPDDAGSVLTLSGAVSGPGSLRLVEWADLRLTGLGNNTFTGGYYGESGRTYLAKTASASALSGPLFVGRAADGFPNAHVIVETLNQIPNAVPITLRNSGALTVDANETLGPVTFEGGWLMAMGGTITLNGPVTNRPSAGNTAAMYGDVVLTAGEHVFQSEGFCRLDVYAVLQGPGGVSVRGAQGTTSFYGANTYAGVTAVESGELHLEEGGRPGSNAAGTVLTGLSRLSLQQVQVTGETLTVNAGGGYHPVIASLGSNVWIGPLLLNAGVDVQGYSGSTLALVGPISGIGGLTYHGEPDLTEDGTLILAGAGDNTYQGGTTLLEGTLVLNKIGWAIPDSLTIGTAQNGADPATVICQRAGQFTPATDAAQMNMWRLTVEASGGLHCNGHDQTVTGITTRGGVVFTEGAMLDLQQGWRVEPDSGVSQFFGRLRLHSLFPGFTHVFNIESNSTLAVWGDIAQDVAVAHVEKQGRGAWSMVSSNSFTGNLTLREGVTMAMGLQPFGTPAGSTRVDYDATLVTYTGTNAEPFVLTGSGYQGQGALVVSGSNYFTGPIMLGYDSEIVTPGTVNLAVFTGTITGPGGITKRGDGKVILAGNTDNGYIGVTRVRDGVLELGKTNAVAIRGPLEIATGAGLGIVRYMRPNQIHDLVPVRIGTNGQFRLLGHSDTIGSLAGSGSVELLAGALMTGNDNTSTSYEGLISGIGGSLTKLGTGTFVLAGANAYSGTTHVKAGTLLVRGPQPWSDVVIQTGGVLGGTGRVGTISDLSGDVRPGNTAYGVLQCAGFLSHAPANRLQIEINGDAPGVNCDQLDVAGSVQLSGGSLQIAMNFAGAVSNQYVIVRNDGVEPVAGIFAGLPQDAVLVANGVAFQIDYHGGDGNDITLVQRSLAGVGPQLGGIAKLNDGTIQIGGVGIPHAGYAVEATENLAPPAVWTEIGSAQADAQGQIEFVDPMAGQFPIRFYRFRLN